MGRRSVLIQNPWFSRRRNQHGVRSRGCANPINHGIRYFSPDTGGYAPLEIPFRQGDLLVNYDGDRFMNEEVSEPTFCL